MARPTKEEKAKREAIKELGLFVRDSEIYTNVENETIGKNNLAYVFCNLCKNRYLHLTSLTYLDFKIELIEKVYPSLSTLNTIDEALYFYMLDLLDESKYQPKTPKYNSNTFVFSNDVTKALEENIDSIITTSRKKQLDKLQELKIDTQLIYRSCLDLTPHKEALIDLKQLVIGDMLSKNDKQNLKNYYYDYDDIGLNRLSHLTLIERDTHSLFNPMLEKNTFLQIDLTKPLEELIELVTEVKKDYDKDPTNISNFLYEMGYDFESFECDLKNCDIYKHKSPKPLIGRLMDVLFIYDCKIAKLNNEYIVDEINKYWNNTKNIHKEKITIDTVKSYHKFGIDDIDNLKFEHFLFGCRLN